MPEVDRRRAPTLFGVLRGVELVAGGLVGAVGGADLNVMRSVEQGKIAGNRGEIAGDESGRRDRNVQCREQYTIVGLKR